MAWPGPVYRDKDGKFGLDLEASEMGWIICVLELRPRSTQSPVEPAPEITMPGDEVPLLREEIEAAVRDRSTESVSVLRRVAALLDALGGPMSLEDLGQAMSEVTGYRPSLAARDIAYWRGDLVRQNNEGALVLNMESVALKPMRRALRKLAQPVLVRRIQQARQSAQRRDHEVLHEARKRQEAAHAQTLRRALLRIVPDPSHPVGVKAGWPGRGWFRKD